MSRQATAISATAVANSRSPDQLPDQIDRYLPIPGFKDQAVVGQRWTCSLPVGGEDRPDKAGQQAADPDPGTAAREAAATTIAASTTVDGRR